MSLSHSALSVLYDSARTCVLPNHPKRGGWVSKKKQPKQLFFLNDTPQSKEPKEASPRATRGDYATGEGRARALNSIIPRAFSPNKLGLVLPRFEG